MWLFDAATITAAKPAYFLYGRKNEVSLCGLAPTALVLSVSCIHLMWQLGLNLFTLELLYAVLFGN